MEESDLQQLDVQEQVLLLNSRDWRIAAAAWETLVRAGDTGITAVIEGLSHTDARVRRGCADFMDHHGNDACVEALCNTALHDTVAHVRRAAVHSLGCQRCKACPLTGDLVPLLIQIALTDSNLRVRGEAVYALGVRQPDARIVDTLQMILRQEVHHELHRSAHYALKLQSPSYRQAVDARAREQGIARAKAAQM